MMLLGVLLTLFECVVFPGMARIFPMSLPLRAYACRCARPCTRHVCYARHVHDARDKYFIIIKVITLIYVLIEDTRNLKI